ncbi:dipeptidase PepV [Halobacillus naozhouensis]|uniref:Dipeptidase PepV n=1 Tax=Halobacillus naozhouensis TaxID=554880 RepID=A0ABY8IWD9_9BACI|nr:dipeptidase PepV [Halobacillus naozhouensis]WFT73538.1 dipeptidase PepV [Halobacillus naozhouensis]
MNFTLLSQQYEPEFIEKTMKLIRIPSVYKSDEGYPYGEPIDQALQTMLKLAEDDGFKTKNVESHAGHIEFGQGEEILGILGHLDVVPAEEGWDTDPFSPVIKDGNLYGRGAQDDKGPIMAAYIAMKLLKDQGFQPNRRVRLILGTDEERDWQGIKHYFTHESMPEFGFSPDASFPVINAEKGLIDTYVTIPIQDREGEDFELLTLESGGRLNMVPSRAKASVKTTASLSESFQSFLEAKEIKGKMNKHDGEVTLSIEGISAHGSRPEKGKNAALLMLEYLQQLPFSKEQGTILTKLSNGLYDYSGETIGLKCADNSGALTLNVGSISWVKGDKCQVGINTRYPVTVDGETVINKLSQFAKETGGTLELYDHLPALYIEAKHPYVQTLLSIYNRATNEEENVQSIGGATYARSLSSGVAFGALFKDSPDTAHQENEHVRIKDMVKAIAIYAESIYQLTK